MAKDTDYNKITSPYNVLLNRENDLTYQFGRGIQTGDSHVGRGSNDGTTQTEGGSVATVALKSDGSAIDIWIKSFIRSVNWKPKTVGFYIDGETGYAEFANIYISGTIVVSSGSIGGFNIGSDYIRDISNTMGMASTVTGGDDVRFWAGDSFANRAIAPFRVLESGALYVTSGSISGGVIAPGTITYTELAYPPLNGAVDPTTIPGAIGQVYVNTVGERFFMSVGTASANDWMLLSAIRLILYTNNTENVTITENVSVKIVVGQSLFDTVTVTEDVTLFLSHRNTSVFDTVTITENIVLSIV